MKLNKGYILGCQDSSNVCEYRCCDQSRVDDDDFCPENAILMYPGEWEKEENDFKGHILVSDNDFNGGKLGYCNKECFDQSKCNPSDNFKPLDCHSYPFFPVISNNELKLAVDSTRCPLALNIGDLRDHYNLILTEWATIIEDNPEIKTWIKNISLDGYTIIDEI